MGHCQADSASHPQLIFQVLPVVTMGLLANQFFHLKNSTGPDLIIETLQKVYESFIHFTASDLQVRDQS